MRSGGGPEAIQPEHQDKHPSIVPGVVLNLHKKSIRSICYIMKLLIVESPSKAKTIEKYLGKDYRVVASVGHVRDLPKSNKKALDIEAGFVPHYEISKGKEKIISEIKALAKKADEVI